MTNSQIVQRQAAKYFSFAPVSACNLNHAQQDKLAQTGDYHLTDEEMEKIRRADQLAEDIIHNGRNAKIFTLPLPVKRDKSGKLTKDYSDRDWFLKIAEETFEAHEEAVDCEVGLSNELTLGEELADIITVCISYLDALGYDEIKRAELFQRVNEKNRKRGYLEA